MIHNQLNLLCKNISMTFIKTIIHSVNDFKFVIVIIQSIALVIYLGWLIFNLFNDDIFEAVYIILVAIGEKLEPSLFIKLTINLNLNNFGTYCFNCFNLLNFGKVITNDNNIFESISCWWRVLNKSNTFQHVFEYNFMMIFITFNRLHF